MAANVSIDRQGRLVLPQRERERLGVDGGGSLELVPTAEGVLLERRRQATIRQDDAGIPLITMSGDERITNDGTLVAIREHRDRS